ncbi:MAG: hypothetical protein IT426_10175 [Pirellulales bacterium]|nr:hypothetical protein [Pirellulales bacterium]
MAGFFAQIDANHDGQIDAGEIQAAGPRAGMVEGLIRRSGMEPKYPIKINSIQEAMQNARGNWNRGGPGGGPPGGNPGGPGGPPAGGNSKPAANAAPLVPGFGVEQKIQPIRGFDGTPIQPGIVAASSPAAGGAPSSPAVPAGAPEQIDDRTRKFAESILRQNDKDHSGALEKNKGEWDEVRNKKEIDKDHNDVITLDELTVYYQALNGSRGPRRNDPGGGGFPGSPPPNSAPQGGATYRIRSPLERLPEGLPDWFARNDANADGQVSMAEFTTSWSADKAKEFARCDLNGDGIVTPQECLRSAPKK